METVFITNENKCGVIIVFFYSGGHRTVMM